MPTLCINCKSKQIKEIVEENRVFYICSRCKKKDGRALIVDSKIKILNTSRGIKHISVAAIIIRDNKILLTDRRTFPFGLEIPVGHLEYNETLEQALHREVFEEVGLKVTGQTLLTQIEYPFSYCRYGSDVEEWAIFLTECQSTDAFINNNESESVNWVELGAIPSDRLTPMTDYTLRELGYLSELVKEQQIVA